MRRKTVFFVMPLFLCLAMTAQGGFESDVLKTPRGDLRVTFIGHASLQLQFAGQVVYVDPDGRLADFAALPKADLILVSHHHGDHFDPQAIAALLSPATLVLATPLCQPLPPGASLLKNSGHADALGIGIAAVPAYNVVHRRSDGRPFHPRGEGNGYVLDFSGFRVYVAGDTENIPEMAELKDIAVAFLPMNLPYTMTPEMTAAAARTIRPRILYPYHYSDTDPRRLVELLRDMPGIDVRIRQLQ